MARTITLPNSNSRNHTSQTGVPQGTPGGVRQSVGWMPSGGGIGVEYYIYILVAAELGLMAFFRHHFRKHHGG